MNLFDSIFIDVVWFTFKQAFVSATVSVAIGLITAPGLAHLPRFRSLASGILFLPNMTSAIFTVLALLFAWPSYPFGFWGIILAHVYMNVGLCTIWIAQSWDRIDCEWSQVACTFKFNHLFYFRRVFFPLLRSDLLALFSIVFSLCFFSFAIPLVLGGGPQGTTFEVLIYERLRLHADVSGALILSLIQFFIQFLFFIFVFRKLQIHSAKFFRSSEIKRKWSFLTAFVLLELIFVLYPLALVLFHSVSSFEMISSLFAHGVFLKAFFNSLGLALSLALVIWILLLVFLNRGVPKLLYLIPPLSAVFVGLLLYLVGFHAEASATLVYVLFLLGHFLVLSVPLFKLSGPSIQSLHERVFPVLRIWKASIRFKLWNIFFPLSKKVGAAIAAIAFCWSLGEFSSTFMISPDPQMTLPLYIQSLISGYRIELAVAASFVLLIAGAIAMAASEKVTND